MGEFESADGKRVQYTDAQVVGLATDLYQYVEHDYKGSLSVDAARLEAVVKNLLAGKPLESGEWDILNDVRRRVGTQFEQWRRGGRDGQGAEVPAGMGRVSEAALRTMPPSQLRELREQFGPHD